MKLDRSFSSFHQWSNWQNLHKTWAGAGRLGSLAEMGAYLAHPILACLIATGLESLKNANQPAACMLPLWKRSYLPDTFVSVFKIITTSTPMLKPSAKLQTPPLLPAGATSTHIVEKSWKWHIMNMWHSLLSIQLLHGTRTVINIWKLEDVQ